VSEDMMNRGNEVKGEECVEWCLEKDCVGGNITP